MKIALDYDGTYTEAPKLWDRFIDDCELRDHEIMIVTFRSPDMVIDHDLPIPVYYTSAMSKKAYMEAQGIDIDIWIDDHPELINDGWDKDKYA